MHQRATTQLALLPAFAGFLSTLGSLNRDYTQKAASHIGAFRLQVARSAQERGGDQASTERALSAVLEQVDLQVRMAGEGFDATAKEVAARMDQVGNRLDAVRKKVRYPLGSDRGYRRLRLRLLNTKVGPLAAPPFLRPAHDPARQGVRATGPVPVRVL